MEKLAKGKDYIGVGIGLVVLNKDGKILFSKRGKKARNERGKWGIPGGGLHFGEDPEDCARREIREEFGIDVEIFDQLMPYNHLIKEDGQHWLALCYVGRLKNGEPEILDPDAEEEIVWLTIAEAEKLDLTLTAKKRIEQLKGKFPQGLPK